jgi:hypothetical protein
MVRALMRTEKPKTMTRRIAGVGDDEDVHISDCGKYIHAVRNLGASSVERVIKPRYEVGDILYVRERVYLFGKWIKGGLTPTKQQKHKFVPDLSYPPIYAADNKPAHVPRTETGYFLRPSIFMPRSAARNFLRATAVRPERLQGITEEDAIAEGVERLFDHLTKEKFDDWNIRQHLYSGGPLEPPQDRQLYKNYLWHGNFGSHGMGNKQSGAWAYQYSGYDYAKDSFSSLWELLNAKRGHGWAENDWVYAYTFERTWKPADWED